VAHEPVLACDPLKRSRRVYEKGAKPPGLKGSDKAAAHPSQYLILQTSTACPSVQLCRLRPRQRGVHSGGRPPRNRTLRRDGVLGMPALRQLGLALAVGRWALWMTGRWLDLKPEHREVTTRCGHRNGRSSVLRPPPGAPKPHHPQRDRCGGRKPWGT
jgi:hypothetical protein